ncbi:MAG: glycosyltransferase family 2 protein [Cyanophyceae cyanobacterium]
MPKVSICIPTYNRAHFLAYAVDSVFKQSYSDFELIICDDGSPDRTPELVQQWHDDRLHYIRHPQNIGRSRNMRSGFEAAKGEYFIKFDDDDALTPDFLEKTVAVLETKPDIDFVCTDHWIIDGQGNRDESATRENSVRWGKDQLQGEVSDLIEQTFQQQSLQVGSTLFRRACLKEVDYMRPQADGCEDFDLLVRLAIAEKKAYFLPEFLMEYRFHGGQTSLKQNLHFLSAKLFCIDSYRFPTQKLEELRLRKLAGTKQDLGLRLIETGESQRGRRLLQESTQVLGNSRRASLGVLLSYLPMELRQRLLASFRQVREKDYTEKVRLKTG